MRKLIIMMVCAFGMAACSSDDPPPKDHVWKTQTDALKKAQELEKKTLEQADKMRQRLDSIGMTAQEVDE